MFFPLKVGTDIKKKFDTDTKSISAMVIVVVLLIGFYLYSILASFLSQFTTYYGIISFLVIGTALGSILLILFRVLILKEDEKLKEDSNSKDDSLERFYKIRETENSTIVDGIEIFETIEGSLLVCMEVLYGPSNDYKANNSLKALTEIYNNLAEFAIDFKVFVTREDFESSIECERMRYSLNRGTDIKLKSSVNDIFEVLMAYTKQNSRLFSTFIVVRFSPVNLDLLKGLKNTMNDIEMASSNSIRHINFVDRARYREFIGNYFHVTALDLGSFRNTGLTKKILRKYKNVFYSVESANEEIKDFRTEVSRID